MCKKACTAFVLVLAFIITTGAVYAKEVLKGGDSSHPFMVEYPNYIGETGEVALWYENAYDEFVLMEDKKISLSVFLLVHHVN